MAGSISVSWSSSHVVPINNLSTLPTQIIGSNDQRVAITFHNPGTIKAYVFSIKILPVPALNSLGGTYVIFPGADITVYGGYDFVNGVWSGFSASSSNNPLTITEMVQ
jgi:hypothetical protein